MLLCITEKNLIVISEYCGNVLDYCVVEGQVHNIYTQSRIYII